MSGFGQHPRMLQAGTVVVAVCAVALMGLILGGSFGYAAATLAPTFFKKLMAMPGEPVELEPIGTAIFLGATAGVLLGGALGAFAVAVHALGAWIAAVRGSR